MAFQQVASNFKHSSTHNILANLSGVECEIGDLIIQCETQKQYDERLHAVLNALQESNVTLIRKSAYLVCPLLKLWVK